MSDLHQLLSQLSDDINKVFDALEVLVFRLALLGLAARAAYALFKRHV